MFKLWKKIKTWLSGKPEFDAIRLLTTDDDRDLYYFEFLATQPTKNIKITNKTIGGRHYRTYEVIHDRIKYVAWFSTYNDTNTPFCLSRRQVEELFSC